MRVLLVEDLKNIQSLMADLLASMGGEYRMVATVPTEAEALHWLSTHRGGWDLAIVDLVLEQGSGMEVIRRCRDTAPNAHIIVFSNFVTPVIRQHCIRLGANAAFDKNAEIAAFAAHCQSLITPQSTAEPRP